MGHYMDTKTHKALCHKRMICKGCGQSMAKLADRASTKPKIAIFAAHVSACGGENLYVCNTCKFHTTKMSAYRQHVTKCSIQDRTCISCQKAYPSILELKAHIHQAHPVIQCNVCNAKFITKHDLKQHTLNDHAPARK